MKFETRLVGQEVEVGEEVVEAEAELSELFAVCIRLTVCRTPRAYWNSKAQSTLP
jgi:hypothetical protein